MKDNGTQLCYLLVIIASIGFLVWGFMDLLKKQRSGENDVQVIQRQIRGFAFIMIAQVVLVVGGMICLGMSGGLDQLGDAFGKMTN